MEMSKGTPTSTINVHPMLSLGQEIKIWSEIATMPLKLCTVGVATGRRSHIFDESAEREKVEENGEGPLATGSDPAQ